VGLINEEAYVKRAGKFVKVENAAIVSLDKNAIYRVMDKDIDEADKPGDGFGKQVIIWQDGKPLYYEVSYTKR